ncbi:MAG: iron-sulfur cluster assembly accessory protein [Gammaproteobacteria bacterium]|nr:iron-sulfur cluster assembly accessory protein [Gammaproteobacteria bacterium]
MITITSAAAEQIKLSAKQGNAEGLPLRLAATKNADGSIHYGMGFADLDTEDDLRFKSNDVTVVVAPSYMELLNNTEIDYVELENGEKNFIFKNPNDPNYKTA